MSLPLTSLSATSGVTKVLAISTQNMLHLTQINLYSAFHSVLDVAQEK